MCTSTSRYPFMSLKWQTASELHLDHTTRTTIKDDATVRTNDFLRQSSGRSFVPLTSVTIFYSLLPAPWRSTTTALAL